VVPNRGALSPTRRGGLRTARPSNIVSQHIIAGAITTREGQRPRCPYNGESGSEDATPPGTTAKRPKTKTKTPHEDFKTPHDQTANAPCPKHNAA